MQEFVDQYFRLFFKLEFVESFRDHFDDVVRLDRECDLPDRREGPDASASSGFAAVRPYRPDEARIHVRHLDPRKNFFDALLDVMSKM